MWRQHALTPAEDFLATLLERQDAWHRAHLGLLAGKHVRLPPEIHIRRPGEERAPTEKRVETDPARIAAFFRAHFKA